MYKKFWIDRNTQKLKETVESSTTAFEWQQKWRRNSTVCKRENDNPGLVKCHYLMLATRSLRLKREGGTKECAPSLCVLSLSVFYLQRSVVLTYCCICMRVQLSDLVYYFCYSLLVLNLLSFHLPGKESRVSTYTFTCVFVWRKNVTVDLIIYRQHYQRNTYLRTYSLT